MLFIAYYSFPVLRPRVSFIVHVHEMIEVHMRVLLRRRQARMTQEFLNGSQISARIKEMRSEGVT